MDSEKRVAKRKERELIIKLASKSKTCREIVSLLGQAVRGNGQPTQLTGEKLNEI